ncbi:MAG: DNA polymerase I [Clostridia bacterium]|nr:DNA polymerase I [Clostridia bacterium]
MEHPFIVIDGNSLMYRAFFALQTPMSSRDGTPTGALHGFLGMLLKLVDREPSHMAVAFDVHGPTFRHLKYDEYKAGRRPTPDDLRTQMPILKDILREMGIAVVECPSYEADDILGTLSRRAERAGLNALLVTGDRDALQLTTDHTHVLLTKKGITDTVEYDPETLKQAYGLTPDHMKDLKALMGDSSDNIPGVPGVGEKTALKLLESYGDLNGVYAHQDEIKGTLGERVRENEASARLSYWLGTIETAAPVEISLQDCLFSKENLSGARDSLERLGLRSILSRLPESEEKKPETKAAPCEIVELTTLEQVRKISLAHERENTLALIISPGFSFAYDEETSYSVLLGETLFDEPVTRKELMEALFHGARQDVLTFDKKALLHAWQEDGIEARPILFDAMIADYLLNSNHPVDSFAALCYERLNSKTPTAGLLFPLRERMERELNDNGMRFLYDEVEMPLSDVLFHMESKGFALDRAVLSQLHESFSKRQAELTERIYELAGERFNILSTKQLGTVLFEKLGLPPQKKIKSGYSTDSDTLEALKDRHPIVPLIMDYRFVAKVDATFVEGLLKSIGPDGRVHTSFKQCVTATGRISSAEPNLQNIPVRTAEGREIRKAFVASPGNVLVGADYSQIELRLLAHISGDENLIDAFNSGADIHRRTAAEVFHTPFEEVTKEQRSAAKAVNFGIVYGISDFGLAQNLGIPVKTAGSYIRRYFERYPGVQAYMKNTVAAAKELGYAETIYGRRRPMPELKSGNYNTRSFGERVAMNMPIQGSAADIIKIAMVRVERALREAGLKGRLVLQIHDELIVDAPADEAKAVADLMESCMENVAQLKVKLIAEAAQGNSWFDTK